ncbi:MAG: hypothetical protein OXU33_02050 [Gemmatimonadota bacterium]|nr:hypothetical protein [Gemmatimonadota bacterium]
MSDSVDHEIRTLQSLYWSERDPDGLAFAPLAEALLRRGDVREAMDVLSDGTSRHPDFSTGHVTAARLYLEQGFAVEAELSARRVLELDSDNIVALSILGTILYERGDPEAASFHAALVCTDPESGEAKALADRFTSTPDAEPPFGDTGVLQEEKPSTEVASDEERGGESLLTLDDLGPPATDNSVGLDVGEESPMVELVSIRPEGGDTESFEDALGLTSEAVVGEDEQHEIDTALDMLGLDDMQPSAEGAAALDALRDEGESPVMDLSALAPDEEPVVDEDVLDLSALAPDADMLAAAAMEPADPSEEDPHVDSSEPVNTRTLAKLYVSQGFTDKALEVYRQLQEADPTAEDLLMRIAELEGGLMESATVTDASEPSVTLPSEEEVETLARDLAEIGTVDHEVDTPFAWPDEATTDSSPSQAGEATIEVYFDQLLGWEDERE